MSSPHALRNAPTRYRDPPRGASSLKIAGAFAGGVACTAVAIALWNGALDAKLFRADKPASTATTASTPPIATAGAASVTPKEGAGQQQEPKSQEADKAAKPTDAGARKATNVADRKHCQDQAWPYLDQRCLGDGAANSSRNVRVISTDNATATNATATTGQAPAAHAETTGQAPAAQESGVTAVATTPSTPPKAGHEPAKAASTSASTQSKDATQSKDTTRASPDASNGPAAAEQQPAPKHDPQIRSASKPTGSSGRRNRRDERRTYSSRSYDREQGDDRGQSYDRRQTYDRHDRREGYDSAQTYYRERYGRDARDTRETVQTYRLPDGRRVTVRRTYRYVDAPERSIDRGSYGRYYTLAPSQSDDDDE